LTRFDSAEEAAEAFGTPGLEEPVIDIGGAQMRIRNREPECCPGGLLHDWAWARSCWLATGNTFEDTHFWFAPQGPEVVNAMIASPLFDDLLELCDETAERVSGHR